jgi:branched-chain amino acid aminotransferase
VVRVPGIKVLEKPLAPEDLERADQVFITSTTRDLLPAVFLEGLNVRNEGSVVDRLVKALEEYRQDYVRRNATPLIGQLR